MPGSDLDAWACARDAVAFLHGPMPVRCSCDRPGHAGPTGLGCLLPADHRTRTAAAVPTRHEGHGGGRDEARSGDRGRIRRWDRDGRAAGGRLERPGHRRNAARSRGPGPTGDGRRRRSPRDPHRFCGDGRAARIRPALCGLRALVPRAGRLPHLLGSGSGADSALVGSSSSTSSGSTTRGPAVPTRSA